MDRTTSQPGTVQAFESVHLYAGVSGYLKTQTVDIGDRVKKDQVLATVDVPDLEKKVQQCQAAVDQAVARVKQMDAHIRSAEASLQAARAAVPQAEALARSKAAAQRFRDKQLQRMRELYALKSIDERLVDESTEQRDAAREAKIAADEGVNAAIERVREMEAKVAQARADKEEAEAEVKVAQAELGKAEVMVQFATIVAPFDGVITQRNFFPNDYVRAATESSTQLPLLTVQRTDLFRVVVQIPDRDVPYCDVGDPAVVEIDALPGQKFPGKVARIADSEDPQTRLMHVEIDLPNKTGRIRHGMYGRVTILLDHSDLLSVPTSCLVGKAENGKGSVYVVRDGRARLVPVEYGTDNGLRVAIHKGLQADDEVILHPGSNISDGTPVHVNGDARAKTTR
jgi:RND family efflux transporter MFP subunit